MTCTSPSRLLRPVAPPAHLAALSLVAVSLAFAALANAETPVTPLRPEAGSFIGALDSISASIVTLVAVSDDDAALPPGARRKRLIGTGVAATERRIITTASLARASGTVQVLLGVGVHRIATLKGVDRRSNIAVFEIDDPVLRPLHRAPPQSMAVGSWVAVLSNVSVTRPQAALGRVVGRGERVDYTYSGDVLEIDAPTYPGTTGGAVVNEDGEWIATVVFRAATDSEQGSVRGSAETMPEPNSLLIALPVDQVDRIAEDLVAYGTVRHGFLGIRLKLGPAAPGDTVGVLVDGVIPGSPAAAAGIRRGDRILALEGQEMQSASEVTLFVQAARPGDEIELAVLRDAEILPVRVLLGSSTDAPRDGERAERKRQMMKLREEISRSKAEAEALERRLRELESGKGK
jgi:S1-C subfamily serine protease